MLLMKFKKYLLLPMIALMGGAIISCDSGGSATDVDVVADPPGALPVEFKGNDLLLINGDENFTVNFIGDSSLLLSSGNFNGLQMNYTYDNESDTVGTVVGLTAPYLLVTDGDDLGVVTQINALLADEMSGLRLLVDNGATTNFQLMNALNALNLGVTFDVTSGGGTLFIVDAVYFSFGAELDERIAVIGSRVNFRRAATPPTAVIDERRIIFRQRREVGTFIEDDDIPSSAVVKLLDINQINFFLD